MNGRPNTRRRNISLSHYVLQWFCVFSLCEAKIHLDCEYSREVWQWRLKPTTGTEPEPEGYGVTCAWMLWLV